MESGFYRLMQEEARQSVEAEVQAKVAEIQAKVAETQARVEAETRAKVEAEIRAEAEEARAKVFQQVTHEAAVKSILAILDARFQSILVQGLKPAIEQIEDLPNLDRLLHLAAQAPSLEAFTETLVQNGNN